MSISLEKRAEKVQIVLEKRNVKTAPVVRVGLVVDTSGSARDLFRTGIMQETVDRVLGVAMKFDDNGELDMWHFNSEFAKLDQAVKEDYGTYVNSKIMKRSDLWGGTSYAPVMRNVVDFYFPSAAPVQKQEGGLFGLFGKKAVQPVSVSTVPAMCFFLTDGDSQDERATREVLREAQKHNVYWNLVGVGTATNFNFLREMADELPNVGFLNLKSLSATDEQIYEELLSEEFCTWVKK